MTKVTLDAETLAKLHELSQRLEFCDETGKTLGNFQPLAEPDGSVQEKIQSPFSDEEIEESRKQLGGRPLTEILADLQRNNP